MNKRGAHQKKARNIDNVSARHDILITALKAPDQVSKVVAKSLVNQRTFAALEISGSNVAPIALNTLKSLANELYAEKSKSGFEYLDSIRLNLKELLNNRPNGRTSKDKVRQQAVKAADQANKLHLVETQNIIRSKAYLDLYGKINTLVIEGDMEETTRLRLFRILDDHNTLFSSLFSPQGSAVGSDEVVLTLIPGGKDK